MINDRLDSRRCVCVCYSGFRDTTPFWDEQAYPASVGTCMTRCQDLGPMTSSSPWGAIPGHLQSLVLHALFCRNIRAFWAVKVHLKMCSRLHFHWLKLQSNPSRSSAHTSCDAPSHQTWIKPTLANNFTRECLKPIVEQEQSSQTARNDCDT